MTDNNEMGEITDSLGASATYGSNIPERMSVIGRYDVECFDSDGNLKWADSAHNLVTTVGKNNALDTHLGGAGYTVTGPFMGLIGAGSYSAIVAGDTMASHAGWQEAGGANPPTYTAPRKTVAFSAAAAGSKASSSASSFAITGTGTAKGAFIVLGSGAVSTQDNTGGVLYSAGLFAGGDKPVASGDTINVSYTATLT